MRQNWTELIESWGIRECSREIEPEADTPPGDLRPAASDDWSSGLVCELRSGGWKENLGE